MTLLKFSNRAMLLLIAITMILQAQSGIRVVQKHTSAVDPTENGTQTISISQNALAIESKSPAYHYLMIFRAMDKVIENADLKNGTFMQITGEQIEQFGAIKQQAMPQLGAYQDLIKQKMEEAKKNMSEEDRKKFEQYTKQHGSPIPGMPGEEETEDQTKFEVSGTGITVGQWSNTTHYVGYEGKNKIEEVWTISPKSLNITQSDLGIFEKLGDFLSPLSSDMAEEIAGSFRVGSDEFEKKNGFAGIPVKRQEINSNGQVSSTDMTEEVSRQNFSAETFQIPNKENLKKQDIMGGAQEQMKKFR